MRVPGPVGHKPRGSPTVFLAMLALLPSPVRAKPSAMPSKYAAMYYSSSLPTDWLFY